MVTIVRFVLFLLLLALPSYCWIQATERIRDTYQAADANRHLTADPSTTPEVAKPCLTTPDRMAEQNKQMIDWGVLLLGGLVALLTTTKVHKIAHHEWWFLILTPAASFILGSLWAGVLFQRRAAYLSVQKYADASESLNGFLSIQSHEFIYALIPLALFALVFLAAIILGRVTPCQEK